MENTNKYAKRKWGKRGKRKKERKKELNRNGKYK